MFEGVLQETRMCQQVLLEVNHSCHLQVLRVLLPVTRNCPAVAC